MKNLLKSREKFGLTEFYCEDIYYGYVYKDIVLKIIEDYGYSEIIKCGEYRNDGCKEYSFLTSLPWKRYNRKDNFFDKTKKFISKFIIAGKSEKVKLWLEFYYHKRYFIESLSSSERKELKDNENKNYLYIGVHESWLSTLWNEMSWSEKLYIRLKTKIRIGE